MTRILPYRYCMKHATNSVYFVLYYNENVSDNIARLTCKCSKIRVGVNGSTRVRGTPPLVRPTYLSTQPYNPCSLSFVSLTDPSALFVGFTHAAATGSLSAPGDHKQPPDELDVYLPHRNYYHHQQQQQQQQQLKRSRASAEQKPIPAVEQCTVS